MQVNSSSSVLGLYQAQLDTRKQAGEIASKETLEGNKDVTDPLVNMNNSTLQFQASSKALKVENEVLGTLIDSKV